MQTARAQLTDIFTAAIAKAYPSANAVAAVTVSTNTKFGHYQCNNAMALAKQLKDTPNPPANPRACAQAILDALPEDSKELIAKHEIAGPGFINIHLDTKWLAQRLKNSMVLMGGERSPAPYPIEKKRVVVDFSSPNIAKEMHVGHLRSTIIGESICRVLEYLGHEVERVNHVGDWGTQFGMLIQHLEETYPKFLSGEEVPDLGDLQVFYKASKKRFDAEPDFKERARMAVVRLQSGDAGALRSWNLFCELSRKEFQMLYDRLGVTLTEKGESFYNPMLAGIVKELEDKGLVTLSDGAKCIYTPGKQLPLMVQKSDGGYNYDSTDMAALKYRVFERHANWIVYVTDAGQAEHFDLIFKAGAMAGWTNNIRLDHVPFGLVLGEDKKKFKTRSSEVVKLVDLLDEAKTRTLAKLREKQEERKQTDSASGQLDEDEIEHAAGIIGYGAVKYADLKQHRIQNYQFSFDRMLDLNGNTAVYLLYALARSYSIIRKSGADVEALWGCNDIVLTEPEEIAVAHHLIRYPEIIEQVEAELLPHLIADWIYSCSEILNKFNTAVRVIGSEQQTSRLLLVYAATQTMAHALKLLGITPLQKI